MANFQRTIGILNVEKFVSNKWSLKDKIFRTSRCDELNGWDGSGLTVWSETAVIKHFAPELP